MAQYSIKDVETLSGVKAHTLRIWEQRYDFLKPNRTDTNIRYYTDDQLRMLLNISTLNRHGMKISRIASLPKEQLEKEVLHVYEAAQQSDVMLDSMVHSMISFDENRFEKTLSSAIVKMGFEESFAKLVFPFMIRTGVLWATGSVRVVQEHFISNLIRRKISAAIDGQFVEPTERSKKFVLFLPEGETHELLLLYTEYMLRKYNQEVAYIGASLPAGEIEFVSKAFKPDYLVTFLTLPIPDGNIEQYLFNICTENPTLHLLVGGLQTEQLSNKLPSNCTLLKSAEDLFKFLKTL